MSIEDPHKQVEARCHNHEDLEDWWERHHEDLTQDQYDTLFEWVIDEPFAYLPLVVRLTLDTADTAAGLADNLERLAPHIDGDLAWGEFYGPFDEKLSADPDLAVSLYDELPDETQDWPLKIIGTVIAAFPEDDAVTEIKQLLQSREPAKVGIAVRGLAVRFEDTELPQELIDAIIALTENPEFYDDILYANAAVFTENPSLWKTTLDIGRNHPEQIQRIINLYKRRIENEHLPAYLDLVELGLEEDAVDDIAIDQLYMEFADETELLADFAVTISDTQLGAAKQLADHAADRNDALLPTLVDRVDYFPSPFHAAEVVFAAGKHYPTQLVELMLNTYDGSNQITRLKLLQKTVGELFFESTYHKHTAANIADFLDSLDDTDFVPQIRYEKIREQPNNPEQHNKKVYYHLYSVISAHIENRDYSYTTLDQLTDYENLKSHFRSHLSQKIGNGTYHPMLPLLQNDTTGILQFLEDNWERIPSSKQQQLLGEAFNSTLSEIGLLLWLDDQGLEYDTDINVHSHKTGEELDKDVDVVVDGNYIEIRTPQTWRNLEVSNRTIGVPNTAYDKIADKFRDDYVGTAELTEKPVFIALDITESEIMPEEVVASLYGGLKIQIVYDTDTGQVVDDRPVRDPDDALQGWSLLDNNLNGVIWYTARIDTDTDGTPALRVEGDVVPNPHHQDDNNQKYCESLSNKLFQSNIGEKRQ